MIIYQQFKILACDRQTDVQMDGWTPSHIIYHAMSHGNNMKCFYQKTQKIHQAKFPMSDRKKITLFHTWGTQNKRLRKHLKYNKLNPHQSLQSLLNIISVSQCPRSLHRKRKCNKTELIYTKYLTVPKKCISINLQS